ncbi:MAG: RNA polymerase factor sigma-54 [Treponema sp.]|jgi:RNA polymerase sigma-54 factor|nr:RNA polymerase factor sigma-54 [Treponema sp.]
MAYYGLEQVQRNSQIQTQRMSQQQIMSLKMLAMNSQDLRAEIYKEAEKNPALEITEDLESTGIKTVKKVSSRLSDYTRIGRTSAAGETASDNFQDMLENRADASETLQDHLMEQFLLIKLTPSEQNLGKNVIYNLDDNGYHILAPVSLLDKKDPAQNAAMLDKILKIIQQLDPPGVGCTNLEESLYLQAENTGKASELALFILDGHLDFLNPPIVSSIIRKIENFAKQQQQMIFQNLSDEKSRRSFNFVQKIMETGIPAGDVEQALAFIRTLDPYPAHQFSSEKTLFIAPDIFVKKELLAVDQDDFSRNMVKADDGYVYRISFSRRSLPDVTVSPEFLAYNEKLKSGERKKASEEKKFISASVNSAKAFIANLEFREATITKAACAIVKAQKDFFQKGPRYLAPLREKDIAEKIGVHEATISRMANSKYLQCEWGLFPIKYFFTSAVPTTKSSCNSAGSGNTSLPSASKEAVKFEIAEILKAHDKDVKKLSDQKISEILAEKGIKIARRTVAKYRYELNIGSSYLRTDR